MAAARPPPGAPFPSGSHRPSEIAQAKSCLGGCRAWLGQVLSRTMAPVRARPRRAPRGNNCLRAPRAPPSGQAGCSQVRLSRFPDMWQSSRSALRRLPPVSRDHGLRLRLKSASSSRLPLSRFCRANLEPWAIVPFVRAVRSRGVNTSGPSPRVKLSGPQRGSFGRGVSPPRLSFRPPAAKPGCCPPSDFKF